MFFLVASTNWFDQLITVLTFEYTIIIIFDVDNEIMIVRQSTFGECLDLWDRDTSIYEVTIQVK